MSDFIEFEFMSRDEFSCLSPGDRVVVVDKFTDQCYANRDGLMDKYLGAIVTIDSCDGSCASILEDRGRWVWNRYCFKGVFCRDIVPNKDGIGNLLLN